MADRATEEERGSEMAGQAALAPRSGQKDEAWSHPVTPSQLTGASGVTPRVTEISVNRG